MICEYYWYELPDDADFIEALDAFVVVNCNLPAEMEAEEKDSLYPEFNNTIQVCHGHYRLVELQNAVNAAIKDY